VASVLSTTGSRGVRISGSNAGYTVFRGGVKSTGYSLHSPVLSFDVIFFCNGSSSISNELIVKSLSTQWRGMGE
jgi:hypothetical protein